MKLLADIENEQDIQLKQRHKAEAVVERVSKGKFKGKKHHDGEIEIVSCEQVEANGQHGVQVLARAWDKDGNPVGFGKDGTVEIERFRIWSPAVLVPDANGEVSRECFGANGEQKPNKKYRYAPDEAFLIELEGVVSRVAKPGENIVNGKVGHTTDTFKPVAGANSPCDGRTQRSVSAETWANCRSAAESGTAGASYNDSYAHNSKIGTNFEIDRDIFNFNTSAIGTGRTISSVGFKLTSEGIGAHTNDPDYCLTTCTPTGTADVVVGDYDSYPSLTGELN